MLSDARRRSRVPALLALLAFASLGAFLVALAADPHIATAADGPALTVSPAEASLRAAPVTFTVVFDNAGEQDAENVRLDWVVNGDPGVVLSAKPDPAAPRKVPAGGALTWDVTATSRGAAPATAAPGTTGTPATTSTPAVPATGATPRPPAATTVVFRAAYDAIPVVPTPSGGAKPTPATPIPHVLVQSVKLTAAPPTATVAIQAGGGDLSEQADQLAAVVVTNTGDEPVLVTVTPEPDDFVKFAPKDSGPALLQPGDQKAFSFTLSAASRVNPGKRTLIFDVRLQTADSDQLVVATHDVTLGVLGDAAVSTLLGVPAFFIVPGVIVLVVWQMLVSTWGALRHGGTMTLTPFEKSFWVLAIAISLVFGVLYKVLAAATDLASDYLLSSAGYGTRDVIQVWLIAFLLPILVYLLARAAEWMLHRNDVNVRDDPLELIRKMGDLGYTNARPKVTFDGHNAFLALDRPTSGGYWVAPKVKVGFTPAGNDANFQVVIRALFDAGVNLTQAWTTLSEAKKNGKVTVDYVRDGAFIGPIPVAADKGTFSSDLVAVLNEAQP